MNSAPYGAAPRRGAVSYIASSDVFVKLPPAGEFLPRDEKIPRLTARPLAGEAVSYIASADVFVKLPPAGRFLCRQRKRRKKPPKETFVVANLAGFVFPVYERAGKTRKCSIAPPLRPEAGGFGAITNGIGGFLWNPSPTAKGETARRFPPLDPPSRGRGGTGVLHGTTGQGDMCRDAAACGLD